MFLFLCVCVYFFVFVFVFVFLSLFLYFLPFFVLSFFKSFSPLFPPVVAPPGVDGVSQSTAVEAGWFRHRNNKGRMEMTAGSSPSITAEQQ